MKTHFFALHNVLFDIMTFFFTLWRTLKCRPSVHYFVNEYSLGVDLVIDICCYVASDTSPLCQIWKQSDHYWWRYCILKIWGIQVLFGCEHSCFSARRVSNFNSNVPQGGIYPHKIWKRYIEYFLTLESVDRQTDTQPKYNSFATALRLN